MSSGAKILKGGSTLAMGNIALSLLNLAVYPIFTRLYSPSDFGSYSKFLLAMTLFSMIISSQYYLKIFKVKASEINEVVNTTMSIMLIGILVLGTLIVVVDSFYLLSLLGAIGFTIHEMGKVAFNKSECFKNTIFSNLLNKITSHLGKILFLSALKQHAGLIYSEIVAYSVSSFFVLAKISIKFRWVKFWNHKKEMFYYFSMSLSSFLLEEWPLLILAAFVENGDLGSYFLFSRLVLKPVAMFGNSFASSSINELENQNNFSVIKRVIGLATLVFAPVIAGLYFYSDILFIKLLGEPYSDVANYAAILSFLTVPKFFKGTINVRQSQTDNTQSVLSLRFILLIIYICLTYFLYEDLMTLLVVLGVVELIFDVFLIKILFRGENVNKIN
jgi:O-antigen/teichoic acid export membrane protein